MSTRHDRTVVMGQPVCTCGRDWPCPQSAEGRWAKLREWLDERLAAGEPAPEFRYLDGQFSAFRETRRRMDQMEGK
jgi:hypothetical protein